ncbi:MAG: hypothetical protein II937_16910 [Bacteroidales bacterium]|nr:hypothetical protein [Bacteroidales bacterium]
MSSIRKINALSEVIYNYVDAYQKGNYADNDVVAVSSDGDNVIVETGEADTINKGDNTECYTFASLVRDDENGGLEPDGDKIDDIANSWLFLD